ncbi:transcription factor HHO5-like [Impatiens glandulifera]|uniref:transcription factor HHO5-like n=1 Tax=Impatiens glandulifera TaxID=253017 RepID=UPI001FB0883A|nr:transcription factor HHO5-like [Impatiens glandulifera]
MENLPMEVHRIKERRHYQETKHRTRLRWTTELHEHFVEAVNHLGGPYKATPKSIMNQMGVPGIGLSHLKSHLQKYRLSKFGQSNTMIYRTEDRMLEINHESRSHLNIPYQKNNLKFPKAPSMYYGFHAQNEAYIPAGPSIVSSSSLLVNPGKTQNSLNATNGSATNVIDSLEEEEENAIDSRNNWLLLARDASDDLTLRIGRSNGQFLNTEETRDS